MFHSLNKMVCYLYSAYIYLKIKVETSVRQWEKEELEIITSADCGVDLIRNKVISSNKGSVKFVQVEKIVTNTFTISSSVTFFTSL